jgi:hypothetical protein
MMAACVAGETGSDLGHAGLDHEPILDPALFAAAQAKQAVELLLSGKAIAHGGEKQDATHAGHSNDADCLLDPQLIRIGRASGKTTRNGSAGVERALCAPAGLGYRQVRPPFLAGAMVLRHSVHGGDRVGDVPLGPKRRRCGVGNRREWQVSRTSGKQRGAEEGGIVSLSETRNP